MWDQFDNYEMFEFTHGSPLGQLSSLSLISTQKNYYKTDAQKRSSLGQSVSEYQTRLHTVVLLHFELVCRHEIARLKITCSDTGALPDESLGHLGHSLSDRY